MIFVFFVIYFLINRYRHQFCLYIWNQSCCCVQTNATVQESFSLSVILSSIKPSLGGDVFRTAKYIFASEYFFTSGCLFLYPGLLQEMFRKRTSEASIFSFSFDVFDDRQERKKLSEKKTSGLLIFFQPLKRLFWSKKRATEDWSKKHFVEYHFSSKDDISTEVLIYHLLRFSA